MKFYWILHFLILKPKKSHFCAFLKKLPGPDFFVNCFWKILPRPFKRCRFYQWYIFFDSNFVLPHCGGKIETATVKIFGKLSWPWKGRPQRCCLERPWDKCGTESIIWCSDGRMFQGCMRKKGISWYLTGFYWRCSEVNRKFLDIGGNYPTTTISCARNPRLAIVFRASVNNRLISLHDRVQSERDTPSLRWWVLARSVPISACGHNSPKKRAPYTAPAQPELWNLGYMIPT